MGQQWDKKAFDTINIICIACYMEIQYCPSFVHSRSIHTTVAKNLKGLTIIKHEVICKLHHKYKLSRCCTLLGEQPILPWGTANTTTTTLGNSQYSLHSLGNSQYSLHSLGNSQYYSVSSIGCSPMSVQLLLNLYLWCILHMAYSLFFLASTLIRKCTA